MARYVTPWLLDLDKWLRGIMDAMLGMAFVAMMLALLDVASLFSFGLTFDLGMMALASALLIGAGFIFNQIDWTYLRRISGQHFEDRVVADVQLTVVSFMALFTFIFALGLEIGAILFTLGIVSTDGALDRQTTFVLFQMIILLVYLMAILVRQFRVSHAQESRKWTIVGWVLTGFATAFILLGLLWALEWIPSLPNLAENSWQATHAITLGIGLEAMAIRVRLRLPAISALFREAMNEARVADRTVQEEMNRKAQFTYVAAFVFVALSMGLAAAMSTGLIQVQSEQAVLGLIIFYSGVAAIIGGLVLLRFLQTAQLEKKKADESRDPLERLAKQKKADPQEVLRRSIYFAGGFIAFLLFMTAVLVGLERTALPGKWATDIGLLGIIFAVGPYGWFYNQDLKRITAMDDKFPDLLRDIAESARAGMTLPRALVTAAKGTYGALTEEVRKIAAQVEWGVAFGEALERFAVRVKTPLIDRTVSLIVEAQRAGGDMVHILTAASEDAREIKQIVKERNEQMKMYIVVVYIAFFVFVAVVLILSAQFIPAFKAAVAPASGEQVAGLRFSDFDPEAFNTVFFHAAVIQAIGGGLVGGVLTRGTAQAGAQSILIMVLLSWFAFRVVLGVL